MLTSLNRATLLVVMLLLGITSSFTAQEVEQCGIYSATVRTFGLTPDQLESISPASHQLENETRSALASGGSRLETIVIPVVFHIIHMNGPENIADEQLHNAIEVLNKDFSANNTDLYQVIDEFAGIVANVDIQFRLARKDPSGNCHSGITRTVSALTYEGEDEVKNLVSWPRNMYLNVWVCESAGGAAGYAYLPGSVTSIQYAWLDGIVIQNSYTGAIGTSNTFRSRTLTHEVGHWLNLRHLWGGSNTPGEAENCDLDDNVSDTPNTKGWTSCTLAGESCGSLDNIQNFLEYSYCGRMFSEGQKTRMRAAAQSSISSRNQLSADANLVATGVEGPLLLCEATFAVSETVVCAGDSILFTDLSYHDVSAWSWNFDDGITLSGSELGVHDNPYHTFNDEGVYYVTLTASNSSDNLASSPITITVLPVGDMESPAVQGFEITEFPSEEWFREDPLNDGGWEIEDDVAYSGSRCLHIENWGNTVDFNRDFLISSTMDLSNDIVEVRISYKWAYCFKGTSDDDETDDRLKISVTGDCGNDWDVRKMHRGYTDLPSAEPHYYPFMPENGTEWNSYTLVLDYSIYLTPHFRVMFEFESRLGNDIYIDDINITAYDQSMLAVEEWNLGPDWNLHPNPSEGIAHLSCSTISAHDADITIVDASGRIIDVLFSGTLEAGDHSFELSPAQKARGAYFVHITIDGKAKALPWIVR